MVTTTEQRTLPWIRITQLVQHKVRRCYLVRFSCSPTFTNQVYTTKTHVEVANLQ